MKDFTVFSNIDDSIFLTCYKSGDTVEVGFNKEDNSYTLKTFMPVRKQKVLSFVERIKWIIKILFTGKPWAEFMHLNSGQMNRLVDFYNNTETRIQKEIQVENEKKEQLELDFDKKSEKEFQFDEFKKEKKVSRVKKPIKKDKRKLLLD